MTAAELRKALLQIIEIKSHTALDSERFIYATVNDSMLYVRVKDIHFIGDEVLVFDGHDSNNNTYTVIQHITQLNMCIAEKPLPQNSNKILNFEHK